MQLNLLEIPESECSCDSCKAMCERPCWPSPEDAERLIDAGYGDKLMLDFWGVTKETIPREIYLLPIRATKIAPLPQALLLTK